MRTTTSTGLIFGNSGDDGVLSPGRCTDCFLVCVRQSVVGKIGRVDFRRLVVPHLVARILDYDHSSSATWISPPILGVCVWVLGVGYGGGLPPEILSSGQKLHSVYFGAMMFFLCFVLSTCD